MRGTRHTLAALALLILPGLAQAVPTGPVWISEIMHDPSGFDWGSEWVELYNTTGSDILLDGYELRWGYDSYAENTLALDGYTIVAGGVFVIGGPTSNGNNGNPVFDLATNIYALGNDFFSNDAFGVALFDTSVSTTLPIHTIIYGSNNVDLVDEQGNVVAPYVGTTNAGESIEFDGSGWVHQTTPNPNGVLLTPEPSTGVLVAGGLVALAGWRSRLRRSA